jgi:drug/metabolite transporter (DMT)-like permease
VAEHKTRSYSLEQGAKCRRKSESGRGNAFLLLVASSRSPRIAVKSRSVNMGMREWLMLLLLSMLWGGSFFFTAIAIKSLPPFTIVFLRVGIAAAILNVVVIALGMKMPGGGRAWATFFVMGLLNNAIPFCLIVWGQSHIASGLAAILNATTPLWTVIAAHFFTDDERLTGSRFVGVGIGLVGVVLMIGLGSLKGLGTDFVAQIAVLAAALSYAIAGVYGRTCQRMRIEPILTATGQVTASTIILLPVALIADRPWMLAKPGLPVWLAIVGIAGLSTALPTSCTSGYWQLPVLRTSCW